jgi:Ca2+-binding RTX toxin-like protein
MTTPRHEILFIDANVSDKETIIAGLSFDIETIILDDKNNVLNQIAEALVGYQNLDAIHIISHGAEGELAFANGVVTNSNINSYSAQLKSIGSALSANGDMLLYGCDIAKGDDGLAFINTLADLTGADVAASDDLTGQSGDWVLEVQSGLVESAVVISEEAQAHYADNLDVLTGTVLGDSLTGGYTDDSISGLAGNDTLSGGAGNDTLLGGGMGMIILVAEWVMIFWMQEVEGTTLCPGKMGMIRCKVVQVMTIFLAGMEMI